MSSILPGKQLGLRQKSLANRSAAGVTLLLVTLLALPAKAIAPPTAPVGKPTLSKPGITIPGVAQPTTPAVVAQPSEPCEFLPEPQSLNTQTDGSTIFVGAQPDRRYRVIIRSSRDDVLATLRTCVSDAFISRHRRYGTYIHAGSFARRSEAEAMRRQLRRSGFRPRVTYGR